MRRRTAIIEIDMGEELYGTSFVPCLRYCKPLPEPLPYDYTSCSNINSCNNCTKSWCTADLGTEHFEKLTESTNHMATSKPTTHVLDDDELHHYRYYFDKPCHAMKLVVMNYIGKAKVVVSRRPPIYPLDKSQNLIAILPDDQIVYICPRSFMYDRLSLCSLLNKHHWTCRYTYGTYFITVQKTESFLQYTISIETICEFSFFVCILLPMIDDETIGAIDLCCAWFRSRQWHTGSVACDTRRQL